MSTLRGVSCWHAPVRLALCLAISMAFDAGSAALADDGAARLRLAALAEEGDLLLEELAGLEPIRQRDRAEAEQLGANERKLPAEVARVEKEVGAYNRAVAELTASAAEHAQACPGNVAASAVEACNERGARLMDRAAELDRQRTALEAQQRDINERVEAHNRARNAWLAARRENAPRMDANAADTRRWVETARRFMVTPDFAAVRGRAGQPAACSGLRVADAGAHFGEQGLKQFHACIKAVLRAL